MTRREGSFLLSFSSQKSETQRGKKRFSGGWCSQKANICRTPFYLSLTSTEYSFILSSPPSRACLALSLFSLFCLLVDAKLFGCFLFDALVKGPTIWVPIIFRPNPRDPKCLHQKLNNKKNYS